MIRERELITNSHHSTECSPIGNDVVTGVKLINLHEKLKDPVAQARIEKEFEKDGSYYNYLVTKIQADSVCSSPFIGLSRYHQEECAELQIRTLMKKLIAYNKTEGAAEYLESLGK